MNNKMTSGKLGSNKNSSLKIFGASESTVKTPTNCIPSSVYLVVKMAHSRRTIRSSEININSSSSPITNKELMNESLDCSPVKHPPIVEEKIELQEFVSKEQQQLIEVNTLQATIQRSNDSTPTEQQQVTINSPLQQTNQTQSPATPTQPLFAPLSPEQQLQQHLETLQLHTIELDTKIIFTFPYPHFLKKGSNQLQIMIQRRKKYKNRAILGFKTLAIGYINLAEVFANSTNLNQNVLSNQSTTATAAVATPTSQTTAATNESTSKDAINNNSKSNQYGSAVVNATVESQQATVQFNLNSLVTSYSIHPELKVDLKCSEMVKKHQTKPHHINKSQLLMANIVISSICLEPVTQDTNSRRHKSMDKFAAVAAGVQQESEDEEFFNWNEDNSDTDGAAEQSTSNQVETGNSARRKLNKWRRQMNSRKARKLFTSLDKSADEQRNFKQRLIALIRKFRIPDSANFDSPEQYEAALERELMVNVVENVEDEQDIEDLLAASVNLDEQGDVCLDDLDDLSDNSTQEFDDCLSISSTPKPQLRPFFSTCTLVGPDADDDLRNYVKKQIEEEPEDVEETENQPEEVTDSADTSGLQPKNKKWNEKRSKLLAKTTNYLTMKDRKSLVTIINLLAKHKNRNFMPKESDNNIKKYFLASLEKVLPPDETNTIPEQISFIQSNDYPFISTLKEKLTELSHTVIQTSNFIEMKTTFNYLINRVQKFCNCNSRAPATIKVCLFGSDAYVNTVLRAYVEYLSNKSPEWQSYMRFYPISLCNSGSTTLSLFLGTLDSQYQTNFCNGKWKELFDTQNQTALVQELIGRVVVYLNNATLTVQIPIAESMIMYKTVQAFVPFICSVKIGFQDKSLKSGNVSIEEDKEPTSSPPNSTNAISNKPDLQNVVNTLNNLSFQNSGGATTVSSNGVNNLNEKEINLSPAAQQHTQNSPPNFDSPGTSANLSAVPFSPTSSGCQTVPSSQANTSFSLLNNGSSLVSPDGKLKETLRDREECLDLQIDYWTTNAKQLTAASQIETKSDTKKTDINNKTTLKNTFRTLHISRLPFSTESHLTPSLTLSYLTKEKKQKIMRLGKKKDRDPENKFQVVDGIHRLVCSYKNSSLKVNVDGVDWTNVNFFSINAFWQTHIKTFPIACFGIENENCYLQSTSIPKSARM